MTKLKRSLALFFAFLMLFSMLATSLIGCGDGGNDTDTSTDTSNDTSNDSSSSKNEADYTVQIETVAGMPVPGVKVFAYLGDARQDVGTTDKNGMITFTLPRKSGYTARVTAPAGYEFEESYALKEVGTKIITKSSVIENPDNEFPDEAYKIGDIMRDLTVKTIDGKTLKLSEILKTKKMVLLNFFFTTCGPCASEFPYMNSSYERFKDDIEIIAINPYPTDTEDAVKTYAYDYELKFPVAKVPKDWASKFPIGGYPTNIIVDRYGMISLVEVGGIISETPFNIMFDYFTKPDGEFVQRIVTDIEQITPTETPNIEMPSNEDICDAINKDDIVIEYYPEDNKMSWPFVIKEDENGEKYIFSSNSGKINSFAQINMKVQLKAGQVLTFDYLASTENTQSSSDIVYVFADGKDIFQIVGSGSGWKTCYAYVADQDGEYEINILYMKNEIMENDPENDGISIKNMRVESEESIDSPTYISKYAATQKNEDGLGFQKYVALVLDDNGYYRVCQKHKEEEGHVCDKNGPFLLAELINVTQFAPDTSITILMYDGALSEEDSNKLLKYCNYASNSKYYGLTAVNVELKELLIKMTDAVGIDDDPNEWLQICEYYSSYGTNEQLANPILGLSTQSAYPTTEGKDNPNIVEYDGRLIMPRGLLYKFVPTKSGVYRVTSDSSKEVSGWIFLDGKETLYTDSTKGERLAYIYTGNNVNNCTMVAYFEAGKEYYIDIAYYEMYEIGTFTFTIDYVGESYNYFIVASPVPFTFEEGENFNPDTLEGMGSTIAGGVDVMLGDDGYYYVKNEDGSKGSLLYADFLFPSYLFDPPKTMLQLIDAGAFDLSKNASDQLILGYISSFELKYILACLKEELTPERFAELSENNLLSDIINGKKEIDDTVLKTRIEEIRAVYKNDKNIARGYFKELWGADYDEYAEINELEDVLAGKYHGVDKDYTDVMKEYVKKMIPNTDERIELHGCVAVDKKLAEALQALMDKFTFEGVEHSWTKLCYYYLYLGA